MTSAHAPECPRVQPRLAAEVFAHGAGGYADAPVPCLCGILRAAGLSQPEDAPADPGTLHPTWTGLGAFDDEEGAAVHPDLPPVVDAHVHLFPDPLFEAIWRWFDAHAWPVRYRLHTPDVTAFLLSRGVERFVALHYAHKPGMARGLNAWMAGVMAAEPRVHGVATVHPDDPDPASVLVEAFDDGLVGVKMHCHVQAMAPDDPRMGPIYEACASHDRPLVLHAGREPNSPAYPVDAYTVCAAERVEAVLRAYPALKLCIPHLGADEFDAYLDLMERYDTLWLDTSMAVGGYFPLTLPWDRFAARPDRVIYGSDFPNLPFAWDRELTRITADPLGADGLRALLADSARALFALPEAAP